MANLQLTLVDGGSQQQRETFEVSVTGASIGRSSQCDWVLNDTDRFISNKHILIAYRDDTFFLTDLSSNGVYVNDSPTAIGKGNTHAIKLNDSFTLGKFRIVVGVLNTNQHSASSQANVGNTFAQGNQDQDLMSIINSPTPAVNNKHVSQDPLATSSAQGASGDLGLFDILNNTPSSSPNAMSTNNTSTPRASVSNSQYPSGNQQEHSQQEQGFLTTPIPEQGKTADALENTQNPINKIPDDWDLSTDDHSASQQNPSTSQGRLYTTEPVSPVIADEPQIPAPANTVESPTNTDARANPEPELENSPNQNLASLASNAEKAPSTTANPKIDASSDDAFFNHIYQSLGLPAEYRDNIDKTAFANDLVQILNTSTQGIMALLAGRSVFKQESRLNMTMIKPQSNNPIKFSLDPGDAHEMLLVKKRPGYMTAQAAYSEALNDIQTHQMAFLSGLQATLSGILTSLNPETIEELANKQGKSFIGIKNHAQKWKSYTEKQASLQKQVSENLNDILSEYFSPAYEQHIKNAEKPNE